MEILLYLCNKKYVCIWPRHTEFSVIFESLKQHVDVPFVKFIDHIEGANVKNRFKDK